MDTLDCSDLGNLDRCIPGNVPLIVEIDDGLPFGENRRMVNNLLRLEVNPTAERRPSSWISVV
jgi:hypothetical protein